MSSMMQRRRMLIAAATAGGSIDVTTLPITYTGNMTDEIVTMGDGKQYRLLTLTSSGTLTIAQPVVADIWLCGGGANGARARGSFGGYGGGGGYVASVLAQRISAITCVVGSATGTTSFGSMVSSNGATKQNGGSGGGGGGDTYEGMAAGSGAGITTYPFGDTTYFSGKPHSAGGSGGSTFWRTSGQYRGGQGGSNGSNGNPYYEASAGNGTPGGIYGGGNGAFQGGNGQNAIFYGSGGGGGGYDKPDEKYGRGGAGYQGVIYARIPLDQKAA